MVSTSSAWRARGAALLEEARTWARKRLFLPRLPLTLYFVWLLPCYLLDRSYWSWLSPLNFGIHELGHVVFAPLGKFVGILGGSLLQCLVPVVGMAGFVRQRDFYAVGVAFCWLATNLYYISWYLADARSMAIPLLSIGGGDAIHDWNYLLFQTGLLRADGVLSVLLAAFAALWMLAGLAVQGWLLWQMHRGAGRG